MDKSLQVWKALLNNTSKEDLSSLVNLLAKIEFVELYTSNICQLHCKHCIMGEIDPKQQPLSLDEWLRVIDQFLNLGVKNFHLAGKEPFLEKNTFEILSYLSKIKSNKDIRYGLITNGLALNSNNINLLEKYDVDYLDFSLDGMKTGHEYLRGKNTFNKTIKAIKLSLNVLGWRKTFVSSAVYKDNINEVLEMIKTSNEFGARQFFIQPMVPYGRAIQLHDKIIDWEEFKALIISCKIALENQFEKGIGIIVYLPYSFAKKAVEESFDPVIETIDRLSNNGSPVISIGKSKMKLRLGLIPSAYWQSVVVTHDGYYTGACEMRSVQNYDEISVGNVRNATVEGLYSESIKSISNLYEILASYEEWAKIHLESV